MTVLLFQLLVGHALCDFPLQGEYMARTKASMTVEGGIVLFWHGIIHAGAVAWITGSLELGLWELFLHVLIDRLKIAGLTTFAWDQTLHVACKIVWAAIAVGTLA